MNEPEQFFTRLLGANMARLGEVARRATRGMNPEDTAEVLAAGLLRAWERREDFQPERNEGSVNNNLAGWFSGIARNEAKRLRRKELPRGNQLALERLVSGDNPEQLAAVDQIVDQAARGLAPHNAEAMRQIADGASNREAAQSSGISRHKAQKLRGKLKRAAEDLEPTREFEPHIHKAHVEMEDLEDSQPSDLDRELARILSAPSRRNKKSECPPCVCCAWFSGLSHGEPRHQVTDPEVAAAIANVHKRKIEIAAMVSAGNWQAPVSHFAPELIHINKQQAQEAA